jgi:hypothetical protein
MHGWGPVEGLGADHRRLESNFTSIEISRQAGVTLDLSVYESVHQLRRNVMWERPLRNGWYSRPGRPCHPQSLGTAIQSASNHESSRHALTGSPLRFTDAISYTLANGAFSLSMFNL